MAFIFFGNNKANNTGDDQNTPPTLPATPPSDSNPVQAPAANTANGETKEEIKTGEAPVEVVAPSAEEPSKEEEKEIDIPTTPANLEMLGSSEFGTPPKIESDQKDEGDSSTPPPAVDAITSPEVTPDALPTIDLEQFMISTSPKHEENADENASPQTNPSSDAPVSTEIQEQETEAKTENEQPAAEHENHDDEVGVFSEEIKKQVEEILQRDIEAEKAAIAKENEELNKSAVDRYSITWKKQEKILIH